MLKKRAVIEPAPPPGFAELRGSDARVVVVPERGALVTSLSLAGREWLRVPEPGEAAAAAAMRGAGWVEAFPTVAPSRMPGGRELAALGTLLSRRPAMDINARGAATEVTSRWEGEDTGLQFVRTVAIAGPREVTAAYEVTNAGPSRLPFVWASLVALPLTPGTHLSLPAGARLTVDGCEGIAVGGRGTEYRWPHLRIGERGIDISRPARGVARRYACRVFVENGAGTFAVEDDGHRLELAFDPEEVAHVRVAISWRGVPSLGRVERHRRLVIGPSVGNSDTLEQAVHDGSAARLEPGETRRWTVRWRGAAPA